MVVMMIFVILLLLNAEDPFAAGNLVVCTQSLFLVGLCTLLIALIVAIAASTNEMYADHR